MQPSGSGLAAPDFGLRAGSAAAGGSAGGDIPPELAARFQECDQARTRLLSGDAYVDVTAPWAADQRTLPVKAAPGETVADLARRIRETMARDDRQGVGIESITLLSSTGIGQALQGALQRAGVLVRVYEPSTTLITEPGFALPDGGHWNVYGERAVAHDLADAHELIAAFHADFPYASSLSRDDAMKTPLADRAATLTLLANALAIVRVMSEDAPAILDLTAVDRLFAGHERPQPFWHALWRLLRDRLGTVRTIVDMYHEQGQWRTVDLPLDVRRQFTVTGRQVVRELRGFREVNLEQPQGLLSGAATDHSQVPPEALGRWLAETALDQAPPRRSLPEVTLRDRAETEALQKEVLVRLRAFGVAEKDAADWAGRMVNRVPGAAMSRQIVVSAEQPVDDGLNSGTVPAEVIEVPLGGGVLHALDRLPVAEPLVQAGYEMAAHYLHDITRDTVTADGARDFATVSGPVTILAEVVALTGQSLAWTDPATAPLFVDPELVPRLLAAAGPDIGLFLASHEDEFGAALKKTMPRIGSVPAGLFRSARLPARSARPAIVAATGSTRALHTPLVPIRVRGVERAALDEITAGAQDAASLLTGLDTAVGPALTAELVSAPTRSAALDRLHDALAQLGREQPGLQTLVNDTHRAAYRPDLAPWLNEALDEMEPWDGSSSSAHLVGSVLTHGGVFRIVRRWTVEALAADLDGTWRELATGDLWRLPAGAVTLVQSQSSNEPQHVVLVQRTARGLTVVETQASPDAQITLVTDIGGVAARLGPSVWVLQDADRRVVTVGPTNAEPATVGGLAPARFGAAVRGRMPAPPPRPGLSSLSASSPLPASSAVAAPPVPPVPAQIDPEPVTIALANLYKLLDGEPSWAPGTDDVDVRAVREAARAFGDRIAAKLAGTLAGTPVSADEVGHFMGIESVAIVRSLATLVFFQSFGALRGFDSVPLRSLLPVGEVIERLSRQLGAAGPAGAQRIPRLGEQLGGAAGSAGAQRFLRDNHVELRNWLAADLTSLTGFPVDVVALELDRPPGDDVAEGMPAQPNDPAAVEVELWKPGLIPTPLSIADMETLVGIAQEHGPDSDSARAIHDRAHTDGGRAAIAGVVDGYAERRRRFQIAAEMRNRSAGFTQRAELTTAELVREAVGRPSRIGQGVGVFESRRATEIQVPIRSGSSGGERMAAARAFLNPHAIREVVTRGTGVRTAPVRIREGLRAQVHRLPGTEMALPADLTTISLESPPGAGEHGIWVNRHRPLGDSAITMTAVPLTADIDWEVLNDLPADVVQRLTIEPGAIDNLGVTLGSLNAEAFAAQLPDLSGQRPIVILPRIREHVTPPRFLSELSRYADVIQFVRRTHSDGRSESRWEAYRSGHRLPWHNRFSVPETAGQGLGEWFRTLANMDGSPEPQMMTLEQALDDLKRGQLADPGSEAVQRIRREMAVAPENRYEMMAGWMAGLPSRSPHVALLTIRHPALLIPLSADRDPARDDVLIRVPARYARQVDRTVVVDLAELVADGARVDEHGTVTIPPRPSAHYGAEVAREALVRMARRHGEAPAERAGRFFAEVTGVAGSAARSPLTGWAGRFGASFRESASLDLRGLGPGAVTPVRLGNARVLLAVGTESLDRPLFLDLEGRSMSELDTGGRRIEILLDNSGRLAQVDLSVPGARFVDLRGAPGATAEDAPVIPPEVEERVAEAIRHGGGSVPTDLAARVSRRLSVAQVRHLSAVGVDAGTVQEAARQAMGTLDPNEAEQRAIPDHSASQPPMPAATSPAENVRPKPRGARPPGTGASQGRVGAGTVASRLAPAVPAAPSGTGMTSFQTPVYQRISRLRRDLRRDSIDVIIVDPGTAQPADVERALSSMQSPASGRLPARGFLVLTEANAILREMASSFGLQVIQPRAGQADREGELTLRSARGWQIFDGREARLLEGVNVLGPPSYDAIYSRLPGLPTQAGWRQDLERYPLPPRDPAIDAARAAATVGTRRHVAVDPISRVVRRSAFDVRRYEVDGQWYTELTTKVSIIDPRGLTDDGGDRVFSALRAGMELLNNADLRLPSNQDRLRFEVERVEPGNGEHLPVTLVPRSVPMDQFHWWPDAPPEPYAHERLHNDGQPDDPVAGNLMGEPEPGKSPLVDAILQGRHLEVYVQLIRETDELGGYSGVDRPRPIARHATVALANLHLILDSPNSWSREDHVSDEMREWIRLGRGDGVREAALTFGNEFAARLAARLAGAPVEPSQVDDFLEIESVAIVRGLASLAFYQEVAATPVGYENVPVRSRLPLGEVIGGLGPVPTGRGVTDHLDARGARAFLQANERTFRESLATSVGSFLDERIGTGALALGPWPAPAATSAEPAGPASIELELLVPRHEHPTAKRTLNTDVLASVTNQYGPDSSSAQAIHDWPRTDNGRAAIIENLTSFRDRALRLREKAAALEESTSDSPAAHSAVRLNGVRVHLPGGQESYETVMRMVRETTPVPETVVVAGLVDQIGQSTEPFIRDMVSGPLTADELIRAHFGEAEAGPRPVLVLAVDGTYDSVMRFARLIQQRIDKETLFGRPGPRGIVLRWWMPSGSLEDQLWWAAERHGDRSVIEPKRDLNSALAAVRDQSRPMALDVAEELRARMAGHTGYPQFAKTTFGQRLTANDELRVPTYSLDELEQPVESFLGDGSYYQVTDEVLVPVRPGAPTVEQMITARGYLHPGEVREAIIGGTGRVTVPVRIRKDLDARVYRLSETASAPKANALMVHRQGGVWLNHHQPVPGRSGWITMTAVPLRWEQNWSFLDTLPTDMMARLFIEPGDYRSGKLVIDGSPVDAATYLLGPDGASVDAAAYVSRQLPDTGGLRPIVVLSHDWIDGQDSTFVRELSRQADVMRFVGQADLVGGKWEMYQDGERVTWANRETLPTAFTEEEGGLGALFDALNVRAGTPGRRIVSLDDAMKALANGVVRDPGSDAAMVVRRAMAVAEPSHDREIAGSLTVPRGFSNDSPIHDLLTEFPAGLALLNSGGPFRRRNVRIPAPYVKQVSGRAVVDLMALVADGAQLGEDARITVPDRYRPAELDAFREYAPPYPENSLPESVVSMSKLITQAKLFIDEKIAFDGGGVTYNDMLAGLVAEVFPTGLRSFPDKDAERIDAADWVDTQLGGSDRSGDSDRSKVHAPTSWNDVGALFEKVGDGGMVITLASDSQPPTLFTRVGAEVFKFSLGVRFPSNAELWTPPSALEADLGMTEMTPRIALAFNKCGDPT